MGIREDLVEAWVGIHSEDQDEDPTKLSDVRRDEVVSAIQEMSPLDRLDLYCQWNGLLGYSGRLFAISQGEF